MNDENLILYLIIGCFAVYQLYAYASKWFRVYRDAKETEKEQFNELIQKMNDRIINVESRIEILWNERVTRINTKGQ
jgi:hypothetical protein